MRDYIKRWNWNYLCSLGDNSRKGEKEGISGMVYLIVVGVQMKCG